jgi:hypothetical protein
VSHQIECERIFNVANILYQFDKMLIWGGQFGKTCDDLQKLAE